MKDGSTGKPMSRKAPIIAGTVVVLAVLALWLYNTHEVLKVRPPEPLKEDISLERPPSTFNLPINIELSVLESYLNGKTQGEFLKTTIWLQEKKKESVALSLSRTEPIVIRSTGRELICTFPLTAEARLIDSRVGKTLAKLLVKPVRARALITLSTPVDIDRQWKLVTRFRIRKVEWMEEPVVKIGFIRKNLTAKMDTLLNHKSQGLTAMLDRELHKAADLKPTISDIWMDLQDPILVSRKPSLIWLRFRCSEIDGKVSLRREKIVCATRIKATMRMLTDTTSMKPPNPLPQFSRIEREKTQSLSDINFFAFIPFEEINAHLNRYLKGKTFSKQGYSIAVRGVRAYGSSKGLSIAVMTDRDLKGNVVISGRLHYDMIGNSLRIDHFDYAVDTGNPVISTGDLVMHGVVRDSIASKLNVEVGRYIDQLPGIITKAVAKADAGKTIDLDVDSLTVRDCQITMGKNHIYLLVNASTKAAIRIKRIKSGKAIRIR